MTSEWWEIKLFSLAIMCTKWCKFIPFDCSVTNCVAQRVFFPDNRSFKLMLVIQLNDRIFSMWKEHFGINFVFPNFEFELIITQIRSDLVFKGKVPLNVTILKDVKTVFHIIIPSSGAAIGIIWWSNPSLTPQVQPWILSAKQGGNGHHFYSFWYARTGNRTHNLLVSGLTLKQ